MALLFAAALCLASTLQCTPRPLAAPTTTAPAGPISGPPLAPNAEEGPPSSAVPACPQGASEAMQAFCRAASAALGATLDDDIDDSAQLLALSNELATQPELESLAATWLGPLAAGHSRAELLGRLGGPLRVLRRAFAQAYEDPRTGLLLGIEQPKCRQALADLADRSASWRELEVTIEPLGRWPLATFERLCVSDRRPPSR